MSKKIFDRLAVTAGLVLLTAVSCVHIDEGLGSNFIPKDRIYEVSTATFPLSRIKTGLSDSLSGYSSNRITVGEIKDEHGNWAVHGSAFTLIPINDAMDFGTEGTMSNIRFHFTAVRDTFSVRDLDQMNIIQNIYVYELAEPLDENYVYIGGKDPGIKSQIGIFTYNGGDSLSFNFSRDFAEKMISSIRKMDEETFGDLEKYAETLPGIYIAPQPVASQNASLKEPETKGGRINMFELPIKISDSYYVTGNYAELAFTADYGERTQVDTSFLFYFGPQERTTSSTQYALNISRNSSMENAPADKPEKGTHKVSWELGEGESLIVEGGAGLKPVISAAEIRKLIYDELDSKGIDPNTVIINKATIVLPYIWESGDFDKSYRVPQMLNPTSRITGKATDEDSGEETAYVTYAGLTDASIETENQGDVDRSLMRYAPDVSHHVQTIMKLPDQNADPDNYFDADLALSQKGDDGYDEAASEAQARKFEDYDMWMLVMADETVVKNQNNSYMNNYYQNLAYANYYNSMYDPYGYGYGGYGYGGYGYGYGSYGYGYNNYYSYLAMAQLANSSQSSTTSTVTQLDKDRYYHCELKSPVTTAEWEQTEESERQRLIGSVPHLKIIYSYIVSSSEK